MHYQLKILCLVQKIWTGPPATRERKIQSKHKFFWKIWTGPPATRERQNQVLAKILKKFWAGPPATR